MPLRLGLERLLASGRLVGTRVGLLSNPASVDPSFRHAADRIRQQPGVTLAALFGPQHGFNADAQDNMIETAHTSDAVRRVPVHSLYSETREPTREMLDGLDLLVVDLQDVGTRVYTFIYTMANCLRACARIGMPVVVCDRPNPIGGLAVEGPVLQPSWCSFVGQFPIPMRHGMTVGELARLFNDHFGLGAPLEVVPMEGWRRSQDADDAGVPWVMPSPNMPTVDTAFVYPGAVLFEGTVLSEGRGTTRPFELVGAPWIDPGRLAARAAAVGLPGVHFRPVSFQPTFHKYSQQTCGGCQIHVLDRATFRPVETAVALLDAFRDAAPDRFEWRKPPYEYEYTRMPIDILAGSDDLRRHLESSTPVSEIVRSWTPGLESFRPIREACLLY